MAGADTEQEKIIHLLEEISKCSFDPVLPSRSKRNIESLPFEHSSKSLLSEKRTESKIEALRDKKNEEESEEYGGKVRVLGDEERKKYQQKVRVLSESGRCINILVIGPAGSGKSTLINNLMGVHVARVSHGIESGQFGVEEHEGVHDGVRIRVYDTAGFGYARGESNSNILDEINRRDNFNLVLLCIDITSRANQSLQALLSDLQSKLHVALWKHFVVVLTFTNEFIERRALRRLSVAEKRAAVEEKIAQFKHYIHFSLFDHVERDILDKIPFCTAGAGDDGEIEPLLEEDWLHSLWVSCIDQCGEIFYSLNPFVAT